MFGSTTNIRLVTFPVLSYCRSGDHSKTVSATLADFGYTNIYEFGGINTWPYEIEP